MLLRAVRTYHTRSDQRGACRFDQGRADRARHLPNEPTRHKDASTRKYFWRSGSVGECQPFEPVQMEIS